MSQIIFEGTIGWVLCQNSSIFARHTRQTEANRILDSGSFSIVFSTSSPFRCSVLNLLAEVRYRDSTQISSRTRYWFLAYLLGLLQGDGVETEVTWEDQQHINLFGRLNNKFHELEDEIKATKVSMNYLQNPNTCCYLSAACDSFLVQKEYNHGPRCDYWPFILCLHPLWITWLRKVHPISWDQLSTCHEWY